MIRRNYAVLCIFMLFFITESFALPRFALKGGSTCIDCHVNPTGGEMRNSRGWSVSKKALPMMTTSEEFEMSNKLNENISFGLDFRGNYLVHMDSNSTKSDFQRMQGTLYTNVQLSEEIDIYARYDFIWSVWEAYAVARVLPNGSYIKGGSFVPNFGIRVDDHTAYTRGGDMGIVTSTGGSSNRGLIYTPTYVESGVEVGGYLSDFALLTASVGNSRSPQVFTADPTYTASLQINPSIGDKAGLFFGGSFTAFKTQRLDDNFQTVNPNVNMFGGFAGIGAYGFSLMGEYDIADGLLADDAKTNVMMIEATYKIIKGLDAVVRYDWYDTNADVKDDEFSRVVLGFEIFPYSFMEIRPQFRLQMEKPSVENNTLLVQFHLFY
jgi:hypothetical protein